MDSLGTDPDLTPEYVAVLRRLIGETKLRAAGELFWAARALKASDFGSQYPRLTEEQIQRKVSEVIIRSDDGDRRDLERRIAALGLAPEWDAARNPRRT